MYKIIIKHTDGIVEETLPEIFDSEESCILKAKELKSDFADAVVEIYENDNFLYEFEYE